MLDNPAGAAQPPLCRPSWESLVCSKPTVAPPTPTPVSFLSSSCRDGVEDGDSQGDGSSQPDTISIASRTSQNTVDSDKVRQSQPAFPTPKLVVGLASPGELCSKSLPLRSQAAGPSCTMPTEGDVQGWIRRAMPCEKVNSKRGEV